MSEREPITAELRELMGGVEPRVGEDGVVTAKYVTPEAWAEFGHRCDAIDAVHAGLERENAELRERVAVLDNERGNMHETDAWKLGYDEGFASADDWLAQHEDAMAEHGWIRLSKDADGEYTNADDEMFWKEDGDSAGRVTAIGVGQRAGWVWTLLDGCNVSTGHEAFRLRHHHAPTVEDVLREFAYGLGVPVADSYVAATAAKLRLAGDAS